tara:strand:- start:756 stop:1013 length:258 start_codon:yes stop_codon:yes gene_type:complete
MIWQDLVISIVNIVFSISLIPQIRHGYKLKKGLITLKTSIPTTLGLYIMAFTFFTLNLPYSAILSFIAGTLWLVLFIQKIVYKNA